MQAKYTTNAFVLVKFEQKRYIFVVHLVRKYFCLYPKNVSSLYLLVNKESNIKCLKYLNYFAKFKLYCKYHPLVHYLLKKSSKHIFIAIATCHYCRYCQYWANIGPIFIFYRELVTTSIHNEKRQFFAIIPNSTKERNHRSKRML